ncbi:hypothetical protein [Streptomyces sp. NBC_01244]|uniref:hypothetical protein n=1 Tax=Streptomyces sp. NBC_01244 TaxID=2903797 RepID=UPI002E0DB8FA|nr:hypothetical protein OG247_38380 [Streptomyces sp. NBC_01244]
MRAGRLIVAPRESTLELADHVALMDGGRITDIGTPAELRARSALFRSPLSTSDRPEDTDAHSPASTIRPPEPSASTATTCANST